MLCRPPTPRNLTRDPGSSPASYQTSEDDGEEAEEGDDVLVGGDRRLPEISSNVNKNPRNKIKEKLISSYNGFNTVLW